MTGPPTRTWLRKAVKLLNQVLASLGLEKHPGKTFIGRIETGFEFMDYQFSPHGLGCARKTLEDFVARAIRLYEQQPGEPFGSSGLGQYVQRWVRRVSSGVRSRYVRA